MEKIQLNNGMLLKVVRHCTRNPEYAVFRLSAPDGHTIGEGQCKSRVLPSRLKSFVTQKINCLYEADRKMLNEYISAMYSPMTVTVDIAVIHRRDEPLKAPTPSYSQFHHTRSHKG